MKVRNSRLAISTVVFASTAIILIVVAAVGFGLYLTKTGATNTSTTTTASTSNYEAVTNLAYAHWGAIGNGNLTATLSQYSSSADLWWYVKGSSLNTTSGAYTGSAISSTWQKFFTNVGGHTFWTVYNYTVAFSSSSAAKVTADVWYVIGSGTNTNTLELPYELDYNLQNGAWVLTADWWGLQSNPGQTVSGVAAPSSPSTTSTTTISQSVSSSSSASARVTTTSGGYGGY